MAFKVGVGLLVCREMQTMIDSVEIEKLRASGALPPGYMPKTELGWNLVRLRAKRVENGGRFLTDQELDAKIAEMRD